MEVIMITKEECIQAAAKGLAIHYTGGGRECYQDNDGPRGGKGKVHLTEARPSGKCKTWKRDLKRFHLPIKYGLYESFYINESNCKDFHLSRNCPIRKGQI